MVAERRVVMLLKLFTEQIELRLCRARDGNVVKVVANARVPPLSHEFSSELTFMATAKLLSPYRTGSASAYTALQVRRIAVSMAWSVSWCASRFRLTKMWR